MLKNLLNFSVLQCNKPSISRIDIKQRCLFVVFIRILGTIVHYLLLVPINDYLFCNEKTLLGQTSPLLPSVNNHNNSKPFFTRHYYQTCIRLKRLGGPSMANHVLSQSITVIVLSILQCLCPRLFLYLFAENVKGVAN